MKLCIFTVTLVILFCLDIGEAIECHICNGTEQSMCDDPFGHFSDNGTLIAPDYFVDNCDDAAIMVTHRIPDSGATMCRKIEQYVNGETKVTRDCAWEENLHFEDPRNNCYDTVIAGNSAKVCTCDMDLCNRAEITQTPAGVLMILAMVRWFLF